MFKKYYRLTHLSMSPGAQLIALDGIVVPSRPLLKSLDAVFLVIVVPDKHFGCEVNAGPLAVVLDGRLRVIKHIVGVDNDDLVTVDDTLLKEVVEKTAKLQISSFIGHEVCESGDLILGRHATPPI